MVGIAGVWTFRVLCLVIAAATLRVLILPVAEVMPAMAPYMADLRSAVLAHIIFATLALALAPFQLSGKLRNRHPRLHRLSGYVYAFSIAVAAVASLALLPEFGGSYWALAGFAVLAVLWIGFTALGIDAARRRDFLRHRQWMLRSVALSFAAVVLRLMMPGLMASGMTYLETYDITAWASWVPSLIAVEWWLRRRPERNLA